MNPAWIAISAIAPIVPNLTTKTIEDLTPRYKTTGLITDWINAHLSNGSNSKAVLLSRMRKNVAGMKSK